MKVVKEKKDQLQKQVCRHCLDGACDEFHAVLNAHKEREESITFLCMVGVWDSINSHVSRCDAD